MLASPVYWANSGANKAIPYKKIDRIIERCF